MKLFVGFLLLVVAHARQERCRENESFHSCGSACPLTCDNFNLPEEPCVRICIPGCHCDEGFVRTRLGNCVKPENCSIIRDERCRENESFHRCGSACPLTCDNFNLPEEPCVRICIPGCHCDEGFVRTRLGNCVKPENCSMIRDATEKNCIEEPESGYCRALFYNWYFDQQTGTCREFVYGGCGGNGNRYWSEEECLENCGGVKQCDENEHFDSCGTACPLTCDNHEDPPEFCVRMCVPGCHCDEGFVRTRQGKCARPQEC